jgi:hypothetical protein
MPTGTRRAFTFVELVMYGGLIAIIVFTVIEGIEFFREWQCRKNMSQINEQLEVYLTEKTKLPDTLDDIASYLKGEARGKVPRCSSSIVPYQYTPLEKKVRCSYHGLTP